MATANDIYAFLCAAAPIELQMDFDNSGFQLGSGKAEVRRVLLALDLTDDVAAEAEELGAELIITHHPLLFTPLRSLTDSDPEHDRVLRLAENGIAVISMHTNLDIARGGVNDVLIRMLGAEPEAALDKDGCGRVGTLPGPVETGEFLKICSDVLKANGLRYHASGRPVHRIAVMGGSGGDNIDAAAALGCDTYVTADIKYHQFLHAADLGLTLIDADHFCTENPVMYSLCTRLEENFPGVHFSVSSRHKQIIQFS